MNPRESVFVDFGCGKGRTLVVAAELGFAGVRGVEFAAELCESAEKNYRLYQKKSGNRADFRIVREDVSDYAVKEGENIFRIEAQDTLGTTATSEFDVSWVY